MGGYDTEARERARHTGGLIAIEGRVVAQLPKVIQTPTIGEPAYDRAMVGPATREKRHRAHAAHGKWCGGRIQKRAIAEATKSVGPGAFDGARTGLHAN